MTFPPLPQPKLVLDLATRMQGCSQTQPVPRAAFRSSYRDKHNRPRSDSNLGHLTPQAEALTIRPLRPAEISLVYQQCIVGQYRKFHQQVASQSRRQEVADIQDDRRGCSVSLLEVAPTKQATFSSRCNRELDV